MRLTDQNDQKFDIITPIAYKMSAESENCHCDEVHAQAYDNMQRYVPNGP